MTPLLNGLLSAFNQIPTADWTAARKGQSHGKWQRLTALLSAPCCSSATCMAESCPDWVGTCLRCRRQPLLCSPGKEAQRAAAPWQSGHCRAGEGTRAASQPPTGGAATLITRAARRLTGPDQPRREPLTVGTPTVVAVSGL